MIDLAQLGDKVCIIGHSNSGKSTLAERLALKMGIPAIHLDQLAHVPHTNWQRRPEADFIHDHNEYVKQDKWIIEGNYSICMPIRFHAATSVIWLDMSLLWAVARYVLRSLQSDKRRAGGLEGAKKEFNFFLVKYTLINYPQNRLKYKKILNDYSFPILHIRSMRELNRYYRHWNL